MRAHDDVGDSRGGARARVRHAVVVRRQAVPDTDQVYGQVPAGASGGVWRRKLQLPVVHPLHARGKLCRLASNRRTAAAVAAVAECEDCVRFVTVPLTPALQRRPACTTMTASSSAAHPPCLQLCVAAGRFPSGDARPPAHLQQRPHMPGHSV